MVREIKVLYEYLWRGMVRLLGFEASGGVVNGEVIRSGCLRGGRRVNVHRTCWRAFLAAVIKMTCMGVHAIS